ncbi:MAG: N-acetylmuramoyl-L-alanine amidase [Nitrospirae bacterium]|nr:N-acetylmuramoyl-L-alanine amidase [Candidatus Troglogloeales bacterium]
MYPKKKRQSIVVLIAVWSLFLLLVTAHARTSSASNKTTITDIRYKSYPTHTRVVIDCDRPPLYRIDRMIDSHLISVHFSKAILGKLLKDNPILLLQGDLQTLETQEEGKDDIVVLLTFKSPGEHKVSTLSNPDRLVIDVTNPEGDIPPEGELPHTDGVPTVPSPSSPLTPEAPKAPLSPSSPASPSQPQGAPSPPSGSSSEIRTIVIDPGHGGDDTGAIGQMRLRESDVVLDVSIRVTKLLRNRLRKEVIMTRETDIFIPLKDRTELANNKNADLFVSIHANAARRKTARGVETYLFGRATDEQALALAARENATDIKSAQGFQEIILNDLLRDFVLNEALELAHYTQEAFVKTLMPSYPTLSLGVKKAPFYVLAHTKMPAILAEISFVSNRVEEQRLQEGSYRQKIAESIFQGIKGYIEAKRNP